MEVSIIEAGKVAAGYCGRRRETKIESVIAHSLAQAYGLMQSQTTGDVEGVTRFALSKPFASTPTESQSVTNARLMALERQVDDLLQENQRVKAMLVGLLQRG